MATSCLCVLDANWWLESWLLLLLLSAFLMPTSSSGGNRPIHIAAMSGHVEAARLLATRGADVDATNDGGQTAHAIATVL